MLNNACRLPPDEFKRAVCGTEGAPDWRAQSQRLFASNVTLINSSDESFIDKHGITFTQDIQDTTSPCIHGACFYGTLAQCQDRCDEMGKCTGFLRKSDVAADGLGKCWFAHHTDGFTPKELLVDPRFDVWSRAAQAPPVVSPAVPAVPVVAAAPQPIAPKKSEPNSKLAAVQHTAPSGYYSFNDDQKPRIGELRGMEAVANESEQSATHGPGMWTLAHMPR